MTLNVKADETDTLDMLKLKQIKGRIKVIMNSPVTPLPKEYRTNRNARLLHPEQQVLVVKEIILRNHDTTSYVLASKDGNSVAYFRAGQYLSLTLPIGGSLITRAYSINSTPQDALRGQYMITVKRKDDGFGSLEIMNQWKIGTEVICSGPQGNFYYEPLRDAKHVIGLAGGSGIAPFLSMAYAIRDGDEDFELLVLHGSRTREERLFVKEFEDIHKVAPNVQMINVLSDEQAEGFEHGFLTAELIKKYMGNEKTSIFMCGPQAMYDFLDGEIAKLGLKRKFIRRELFATSAAPWKLPGYPAECKDKVFKLHVDCCQNSYDVKCKANETLLVAMERAGIHVPSHCRGGKCGWCRSKLLSGDVFIPDNMEYRRKADVKFRYIYTCVTYPISDISIEISNN